MVEKTNFNKLGKRHINTVCLKITYVNLNYSKYCHLVLLYKNNTTENLKKSLNKLSLKLVKLKTKVCSFILSADRNLINILVS